MDKIRVSEKANYSNGSNIPIGSHVQIISKEYVKFDIDAMMGRLGPGVSSRYVTQEDEDKFEYGVLKGKEAVPYSGGAIGGHGGTQKFTVQLDSGEERTFIDHQYYFRVMDAPTSGGYRKKRKMSRKIRKTRKVRKVIRKSRRM